MRHAFQCLVAVTSKGTGRRHLLAAAGPILYNYDVDSGNLLSTWPDQISTPDEQKEGPSQEPPHKKQRQSIDRESLVNEAARSEEDEEEEKSRSAEDTRPNITKLTSTKSGEHVVAVTAEDKALRVFSLNPDGKLRELSKRCMPKRPCAIAVSADDSTLVCADKFGDVYSLPLLFDPKSPTKSAETPSLPETPPASRSFVPSANELTVHTGRNHRALQNQLKLTNKVSEKKSPEFEHKLLLGHVSMLVDLVLIPHEKPSSSTLGSIKYIITSDRDEHIRVSRGPPQTHIIHEFCYGHTEFVTKLCIPPWQPQTLISAGGDGTLKVWNWESGKLRQSMEVTSMLYPPRETTDASKPIISGLWALPVLYDDLTEGLILASCEDVPSLCIFALSKAGRLRLEGRLELKSGPTDVAVLENGTIIVALSPLHVDKTSTDNDSHFDLIQTLQMGTASIQLATGARSDLPGLVHTVNATGSFVLPRSHVDKMKQLLDRTSSLRKQRPEDFGPAT